MEALQKAKNFLAPANIGGPFGAVSTVATSRTLPILLGIVGVFIVAIIIFVVIKYRAQQPQLLMGPVDLYDPKPVVLINRATANTQMKGSYTYAFYAKIDSVPDMRSGGIPLMTWAGVWSLNYIPAEEQFSWRFNQSPDEDPVQTTDTVTVPHATLQRWNQYVIAFEGRTADFYVNGKLIKSALLNNVPPSASSSITVVPREAFGQVAYVQLWPRRLTTSDVAANYADTSDSQGRPYIGPGVFSALSNLTTPNLFCPGGKCGGSTPTATPAQTWEFPYQ